MHDTANENGEGYREARGSSFPEKPASFIRVWLPLQRTIFSFCPGWPAVNELPRLDRVEAGTVDGVYGDEM